MAHYKLFGCLLANQRILIEDQNTTMNLGDFVRWFHQRVKPRQIEDPVFGMITFYAGEPGLWELNNESDDYCVRVFAGESGPTPAQRALFNEFKKRRRELEEPLEKAMFDEYNVIRDNERIGYEQECPDVGRRFDEHFPPLKQTSDIWKIAHLSVVEICEESNQLDLGLIFRMDWGDEEHDLMVDLKNWQVVDVGKEG